MIQIQNLSFGYGKNNIVFDDLNLDLRPGNVYGLLGKNGAGKSSLMRMMAGLLFPTQGTCMADGIPTKSRKVQFLENMYFLPEEFDTPNTKIADYVSTMAGFYPKFNFAQFDDYLKEFEITSSQNFKQLSLGEKKKVMIGFGLATNTNLLLMDEPTNGLDIPSKAQFRRIMAAVASEERTIVISTHQIRDLESLIDPVVILADQNVLLNASIQAIEERYLFGTIANIDNYENLIYSETSMRGFEVVTKNIHKEESKVNLEMLFNALTHTH